MFNTLWDRTFEGILPREGALNLDVFHMKNFRYDIYLARSKFFCYCNSLKTLCVVHPNENQFIYPPEKLKKLVMYCPKSRKEILDGVKTFHLGLGISFFVEECPAKEM